MSLRHCKKKKIVYIIRSLEIGGAELQLYMLIRNIHNRYYQCHVFPLEPKGPLLHSYRNIGVPLHLDGMAVHESLREKPWKLIPIQWRLLRIINKEKPHVVHAFLPLATFLGAVAGRLCKVPLVISSRRALGTHQDRVPFTKPLDYMAYALSHKVTVNSQAVCADTLKRDRTNPSKLVLIYNGICSDVIQAALANHKTMRKQLSIASDERVIIVVANLVAYKGHEDFLKALSIIIRHASKVTVLFAGEDRGIKSHLEALAATLNISSHIRFLGQRNDIPQLLAASDLSVLPSHEEGFSNVILESMAAGLPLVATHVGGNPEAIVNGETGWLVPPRDPGALAEKIIDLLNDPDKAEQWGNRNLRRVKQLFSVQKMIDNHLSLYGQMKSSEHH